MNRKTYLKAHTITFTSYISEAATVELLANCDWYLFGRETCPKTGRLHLQGMAWCRAWGSWTKLQNKMHVEACRDTAASITYCKKDGNWIEFGTPPKWAKPTKITVADLEGLGKDDFGRMAPGAYNSAVRAL